jgi:hypothetical protein
MFDAEQVDQLELLYDAAVQGEQPRAELHLGAPVLGENDPRLLFQEQEFERARPFSVPASVLAEASSLPVLVAQRAEATGLAIATLEEELADRVPDRPQWLRELAAGSLDIAATVPVKAMKDLLQALRVPPSRRAVELVRTAVYRTFSEGAAPAAPMLARRRRGRSLQKPQPTDEERQVAADRYATRLYDELFT